MPSAFTQAQLKFFAEQTERAAQKAARHVRNQALIGFVILLAGIGYALHETNVAIESGAAKSRAARGAVCKIITRGDASIYRYQHEGTITLAQRNRALIESVHARKTLGPAPGCTTTITPESKPK